MTRERLKSKPYEDAETVTRLGEQERHIESTLAIEGVVVSIDEIRKSRTSRREASRFGVSTSKVKIA